MAPRCSLRLWTNYHQTVEHRLWDMHPDIRRPWKLGEFRDITSAQACFLTEPCMAQIELLIVIKKKKSQFAKMSSQIGPQRVPQGSCRSRPGRPRPRPGTPAWPAPGPARAGPASPAQAGALGHPLGTYVGRRFGELPPSPGPLFGALFGPPRGRFGTPRGVEKGGFWGVLGSFPGRVIFGTPHR